MGAPLVPSGSFGGKSPRFALQHVRSYQNGFQVGVGVILR